MRDGLPWYRHFDPLQILRRAATSGRGELNFGCSWETSRSYSGQPKVQGRDHAQTDFISITGTPAVGGWMFGVLAEDEPRKQPGTLFEQSRIAHGAHSKLVHSLAGFAELR